MQILTRCPQPLTALESVVNKKKDSEDRRKIVCS